MEKEFSDDENESFRDVYDHTNADPDPVAVKKKAPLPNETKKRGLTGVT
jgi:hypothetical protein